MTDLSESAGENLKSGVRPYAIFAIVGVFLFWAITFILGFIQPGYSHIDRAISELGMLDAPYSLIQRINFVLLGFAMFAFAFALHRAFPGSGLRHWLAPGLLLVHGLGRMGEGIFAWNPFAGSGSLNNALHNVSSIPGVLSMLFIPFAVYWMMRAARAGQRLQWYTLATGALFFSLFIVIGPVGIGPTVPLGLGQRVGFLIWYLWVVIVAGSMLKDVERSA
jgi:hypothetical membrane protein